MNLSEARALQPGDYIASAYDVPEWTVRRVTDRWTSVSGAIVRVKLFTYGFGGGQWVDVSRLVKVPQWKLKPTRESKGVLYRNGDVLAPEHRPLQTDTKGVQEAEPEIAQEAGSEGGGAVSGRSEGGSGLGGAFPAQERGTER